MSDYARIYMMAERLSRSVASLERDIYVLGYDCATNKRCLVWLRSQHAAWKQALATWRKLA